MFLFGTTTEKVYETGPELARAGESIVYTVVDNKTILIKILTRPLTPRQVEKLKVLAALTPKPDHAAIPIEIVVDLATRTPVGFVQPYFTRAIPLTRVLDSFGRHSQKLPNDLTFRVKLCRLLAESFARIHVANLVAGDVSDGNFLVSLDWLRRIRVINSIDCNSYQFLLRTPRGNEFFPSGVAAEEYAAPEVQPTDWSTSQRSIYSDSFGFAVLAWKIIFGGSHPFAVITPPSVDVPPIGKRIEDCLFPFCPGSPIPANWSAPPLQPSLAVLPVEIRELFFRAFSTPDPRDRATSTQWCEVFRSWELALAPSLPLRILGTWDGSVANRLAETLSLLKPYLGKAIIFTLLVTMAYWTSRADFSLSSPPSKSSVPRNQLLTDSPKPNRKRPVDTDLFPEPFWQPSKPAKE